MIAAQRVLPPTEGRSTTSLGLIQSDYAESVVLDELARRLSVSGGSPFIRLEWAEQHGPFVLRRSLTYHPDTARLSCRLAGDEILFVPVTAKGIHHLVAAKKRNGFAAVRNLSSSLLSSHKRPFPRTANLRSHTL